MGCKGSQVRILSFRPVQKSNNFNFLSGEAELRIQPAKAIVATNRTLQEPQKSAIARRCLFQLSADFLRVIRESPAARSGWRSLIETLFLGH